MIRRWEDVTSWAYWSDGGYLAEDLTRAEALTLGVEAQGYAVPQAYVTAHGNLDRAWEIADRHLDARVREARERAGTGLEFGPTQQLDNEPMWWVFRRYCRQWQEMELIPGAVSCTIDRIDLHLWQPEELDDFWAAQGLG